jgi:hypothetical protein
MYQMVEIGIVVEGIDDGFVDNGGDIVNKWTTRTLSCQGTGAGSTEVGSRRISP